jgi:hypothetical protein
LLEFIGKFNETNGDFLVSVAIRFFAFLTSVFGTRALKKTNFTG